jgi:hypothetical protein
MVTAEFIYAKSVSALSPATEVTFTDGQLSIPLAQVSDGDLHRFEAKENGATVRFWLYQNRTAKLRPYSMPARFAALSASTRDRTGGLQELRRPYQRTISRNGRRCNPIPFAEQTSDALSSGRRISLRCPHFPTLAYVLAPTLSVLPAAEAAKLLAG